MRALRSESQRALAIRVQVHLGMTVRFFDFNDGTFHSGRIVLLRERSVNIDDPGSNLRYTNVPYAAIDLRTPPAQPEVALEVASSPHPRPAAKPPARAGFKVGDRVIFHDHDNVPVIGTVNRVNQKTVSVTPDNKAGRRRVSAAFLNHLVDVSRRRRSVFWGCVYQHASHTKF